MSRSQPDKRKQRRYDRLAILDYIDTYKQTHNNRSPSQRRIREALEMSAPSVAHNTLHRLARGGLLQITTFGRGLGAELDITEAGYAELRRWRAKHTASQQPAQHEPD